MCNVYRPIGSLGSIKSHLQRYNVAGFNSVNELITFQKGYPDMHEQIISEHKRMIELEGIDLNLEIAKLEESIKIEKKAVEDDLRQNIEHLKQQLDELSTSPTNIIKRFSNYLKKLSLKKKIQSAESNFEFKITSSVSHLANSLSKKRNRLQFITSNFEGAVLEASRIAASELKRKKEVIDAINNSIYGAIGEQKVVKEIEKLSDDYFLINDFCYSFYPPLHNRQEGDYIRSVQIDHLLVSPSGLFLIETKNWSDESLNNLNLRSPVQQIRRANFALYRLLNGGDTSLPIKHHWGNRKISIRNLIVLTNNKPQEEFQYVKIVTLSELLNYVKYFKPTLSAQETQGIVKHLLNISQ